LLGNGHVAGVVIDKEQINDIGSFHCPFEVSIKIIALEEKTCK
jgi:hypothetical protein